MHQILVSQNSSLSPAQAAWELIQRRKSRESLRVFIEYLDLGFIPAAHHCLLIDRLEAVERGELTKLMVLMPPGSAKSTYASVLFPPWFMGRNPQAAILAISNRTELAERFSRRSRNLVSTERYRNVFGFSCAEDSRSAGNWENEQGGEFFAAGVGAAIAGRRADLGLIDDPIGNREDADSERVREKQWDWYINDFLTRLKPGARQILIQTRWHEDDLGGRILEREANTWHVIKLPMEAGADDPIGRHPGERLWPEWFTEQMVMDAKRDARSWSALYQQEPAPEEGTFFKRDWFAEYLGLPSQVHFYGASDYAVTDGDGDYTEHGIFALDFNDDLYLVDWWRDQAPSNEWIESQCDLIAKYKPLCWFGEKGVIEKAVGPALKQRMIERRTPCRLEWLPSITDKPSRARPFQARASMGRVRVPKHVPWWSDLNRQLMQFPAGKYDDGVDVCSLIGRGLEHVQAPTLHMPKSQSMPMPTPGGWMT